MFKDLIYHTSFPIADYSDIIQAFDMVVLLQFCSYLYAGAQPFGQLYLSHGFKQGACQSRSLVCGRKQKVVANVFFCHIQWNAFHDDFFIWSSPGR
jgi:hypothetical protein